MAEITIEGAQRFLNHVSEEKGFYAGIPMPLEDMPLVVHKGHPLRAVFQPTDGAPLIGTEIVIDNQPHTVHAAWDCRVKNCTAIVLRGPGPVWKHWLLTVPAAKPYDLLVNTLSASAPWTLAAETKALSKLMSLITAHQMEMYVLTGCFVERSKKSGVTYMFRRLRPTIAVREIGGVSRTLCGLCLHPIGYYQGSFGGVMVPTDDVIAHLLLMRGCEHRYWREANQHPETSVLSGIGA